MARFLLEHPKTKWILIGLVYLLVAFLTAYGFYLITPIITSYGRDVLTFLPLILTFYVPLFLFISGTFYFSAKNIKSKQVAILVVGVSLSATMLFAFIYQTILIANTFGWKLYHNATYLFPFDTWIFSFLYLCLGILLLIKAIKDRTLFKVTKTIQGIFSKRIYYVLLTIYFVFSTYLLGAFMFVFSLCDHFDSNWLGIIPFTLLLLLPSICLLYFLILKFSKKERSIKRELIAASIIAFLLIVLISWFYIVFSFVPTLIGDTLFALMPLGSAISKPVSLYMSILLTAIFVIILFIRCLIPLINRKEN